MRAITTSASVSPPCPNIHCLCDSLTKCCTVLDKTPMFSVYSQRNGQPFKHEVKALEIIWKKFPGVWSKKDSIHIDDLSRNFGKCFMNL